MSCGRSVSSMFLMERKRIGLSLGRKLIRCRWVGWIRGKTDITFEMRILVLSILLFFSWRICSGGEFALENKRVDSCSQESSHAWKSVKSERIYVHTKVCHGGKTKQKINSRSGTSGLEISTRDRVGISRFPTGLS